MYFHLVQKAECFEIFYKYLGLLLYFAKLFVETLHNRHTQITNPGCWTQSQESYAFPACALVSD